MTDEYVEEGAEDAGIDIDAGAEDQIDDQVEDRTDEQEGDQLAEDDEGGDKPPAKVEFSPEQQEILNREIAKQAAKRHEEKRRADELAKQIEDLQAKLPKEQEPEIPPAPDPYAENYQQLVQERDQAIQRKVQYDLQQRIQSEYQLQQQQAQQNQLKEQVQKANAEYVERGEKLGHDQDTLITATNSLIQSGLSQNAQIFLRDDKAGPDMAMYLAKNPTALEEIAGMSDVMAIAHLATEIREKASGTFRKDKSPPPPVDHLTGKGASEGPRGPKGAKFE